MRMARAAETKFARSGDVNIAYQVFGEGERDPGAGDGHAGAAGGGRPRRHGRGAVRARRVPDTWQLFAVA